MDPGRHSLAAVRGWPLDELEMSTRLRNCLMSRGWERVGDLEDRTEREFLLIPNFGPRCMRELQGLLERLQVGIGLKSADVPLGTTIWSRLYHHPLIKDLTQQQRRQLCRDVLQPRHS